MGWHAKAERSVEPERLTMPMHAARIDTDSKPGRIYDRLMQTPGQWVDAWELFEVSGYSTAVSTNVAAVRKWGETVDCHKEWNKEKKGWRVWYRIVVPGEQMELAG